MSVRSPTAGTWSSSQWRPDNEFETDGFRERGMALSLSYNPTPRTPLGALLHEGPARVGRRGPHFSGPSAGATLQG